MQSTMLTQNYVLHLDIKPSNVMVGDFGEVHILDWGIATLLTDNNKYLNDNKVIGGTPGYMSPEQALGHHEDLHFHYRYIYVMCIAISDTNTTTTTYWKKYRNYSSK